MNDIAEQVPQSATVDPITVELVRGAMRSIQNEMEALIDRFPSDVTSEASHTALYDYLVAGSRPNLMGTTWTGPGMAQNR